MPPAMNMAVPPAALDAASSAEEACMWVKCFMGLTS